MISRANLPPQWSGNKKRLTQPVHLLRDSSPYFISRSMLPSRMHGPFFRFLPKDPSFGDGKQGKCGHTASKEARSIPFLLCKNFISAPSFFLFLANPLRWALLGATHARDKLSRGIWLRRGASLLLIIKAVDLS